MHGIQKVCVCVLVISLHSVVSTQNDQQRIVSGSFGIKLIERDGNEWSTQVMRDTMWQHVSIPLTTFGEGSDFLNAPVTGIALLPIGGGGIVPGMSTVVIDWLDQLMLANSLIDNFDDSDYTSWRAVIATNGSYLFLQGDSSTPDKSTYCLKLTHGNDMGDTFVGWLDKELDSLWCSPDDTLTFWLRGVSSTPNHVGEEQDIG